MTVTRLVEQGRKKMRLAGGDSGGLFSSNKYLTKPTVALSFSLSRSTHTVVQFSGFFQLQSLPELPTYVLLSSLYSISVPLHNLLLFIQSLHANYCNQTQVFLNLHLTYLLTARPPSLSLTADLAGPRPPCHIPPPPDSGEPPRPAAHAPPPPFLERKSATAVEPLQGCIMVQIESEFPSLEIIVKGENRPLDC